MSYSIINVIKDALTGKLRLAPSEVVTDRKSICAVCEAQQAGICTACGCVIKFKVRVAKSECPMDLWQAVDPN